MANINQLSQLTTVSAGDLLPVYSQNNGDARKVAISALLTYFQQQFASPTFATQAATPTTGFSIAVQQVSSNTWLLLTPAGTLAAGTITLPLNSVTPDGQELLVSSTQVITALSVSLNGAAAANGFPTTLAANGFFRMRFYQPANSWYRVG